MKTTSRARSSSWRMGPRDSSAVERFSRPPQGRTSSPGASFATSTLVSKSAASESPCTSGRARDGTAHVPAIAVAAFTAHRTCVLKLRDFTEGDRAYVVATWSRSSCSTRGASTHGADLTHWKSEIAKVVADVVFRGRIVCAVDEEAPENIVGWAAKTGDTLHYVYVRGGLDGFRGKGVARALVDVLGKLSAYSTKPARHLPFLKGMKFKPCVTFGVE